MKIINTKIHSYINNMLPERDSILHEMESLAKRIDFPIVGPQVGRFLCQLAFMQKPNTIFELGSGFGYSAYWFLLGSSNTIIHCTDTKEENSDLALSWFSRAGFSNRVIFHIGKAEEVLSQSGLFFDIIFNDVDKEAYPDVFNLALMHLNAGGMLISDNVLWDGRIIKPSPNDKATHAILEYNRLMFNTPGIFSTIIPIRDGLGVSIKMD